MPFPFDMCDPFENATGCADGTHPSHLSWSPVIFQKTLNLIAPVVVKEQLEAAFVVFSCWTET